MELPHQFTEKELREWMAAPQQARDAVFALLKRAEDSAIHTFASAATDREAAVSQGHVRCAQLLIDTLRDAPAKFAALARRGTSQGNPPRMAGVV